MIHVKRLLMGVLMMALVSVLIFGLLVLLKAYFCYVATGLGVVVVALFAYSLGKDVLS